MKQWLRGLRRPHQSDGSDGSDSPPPLSLDAFRGVLRAIDSRVLQGKGNNRHSPQGLLETDDVWKVCEAVGLGFPLGQALKKIHEFQNTGDIHELFDAAAYLVFAAMWVASVGEAVGSPLPPDHPHEEVSPGAPSGT